MATVRSAGQVSRDQTDEEDTPVQQKHQLTKLVCVCVCVTQERFIQRVPGITGIDGSTNAGCLFIIRDTLMLPLSSQVNCFVS